MNSKWLNNNYQNGVNNSVRILATLNEVELAMWIFSFICRVY